MLVCLEDLLGGAGSPASPLKWFRKVPAWWHGLVPEYPPHWPWIACSADRGLGWHLPLPPGRGYLVLVLDWACLCPSPLTPRVSLLLVVSGIWGPSSGLLHASFLLEWHIQFWSIQVFLPCARASLYGGSIISPPIIPIYLV